jgi:hypothetical protein
MILQNLFDIIGEMKRRKYQTVHREPDRGRFKKIDRARFKKMPREWWRHATDF